MFAPVASLDQTNKQGKISEAIGDKAQILLELFHLSLPTVVTIPKVAALEIRQFPRIEKHRISKFLCENLR
jgi:hypothetical protein